MAVKRFLRHSANQQLAGPHFVLGMESQKNKAFFQSRGNAEEMVFIKGRLERLERKLRWLRVEDAHTRNVSQIFGELVPGPAVGGGGPEFVARDAEVILAEYRSTWSSISRMPEYSETSIPIKAGVEGGSAD